MIDLPLPLALAALWIAGVAKGVVIGVLMERRRVILDRLHGG